LGSDPDSEGLIPSVPAKFCERGAMVATA
jgi:hypothetical protein